MYTMQVTNNDCRIVIKGSVDDLSTIDKLRDDVIDKLLYIKENSSFHLSWYCHDNIVITFDLSYSKTSTIRIACNISQWHYNEYTSWSIVSRSCLGYDRKIVNIPHRIDNGILAVTGTLHEILVAGMTA